jgi:hypothetical protein
MEKRTMADYTNAVVEWSRTSIHGTVALRTGDQTSKFAEFANPMGLPIAVCAGLMGKTVNFSADDAGNIWKNVQITGVN